MAKDATPDEIQIVDDNFANENHREIATLLEDEWDASTKFSALGEEYDPHRATFQSVYNKYFGVPESLFRDGIDDQRTIEQIKEAHGSYKEYRELRNNGYLDPDEYRDVEYMDGFGPETEEEMIPVKEALEMCQEEYRKGHRDGFQAGLEASR